MSPFERFLIAVEKDLGPGAAQLDLEARASVSKDESEASSFLPLAVLRATDSDAVRAVLKAANEERIPVVVRAAGTSRTGASSAVDGSVILHFEPRADGIFEIDELDQSVVVHPSLRLGDLERELSTRGWFYAPDPSSYRECTVGGSIATNAGGPSALKYGATRQWVRQIECISASGDELSFGNRASKTSAGYDFKDLLIGSEGTLAVTTRATLRIERTPERRVTILATHSQESMLSECLRIVGDARMRPRCLEFLDAFALRIARDGGFDAPASANVLLAMDLDGDFASVEGQLEEVGNRLDVQGFDVRVALDAAQRESFWKVRHHMSRAIRAYAKHKLSEDLVVPRSKVGAFLQAVRESSSRHQVESLAYGHLGDGNLHLNYLWNEDAEKQRIDSAMQEAMSIALSMGGALSGEHGIGLLKRDFFWNSQSSAQKALLRNTKIAFDPQGILNPGKLFPRS